MAKLKIKNIFWGAVRGVFYLFCLLLFFLVAVLVLINLPPVKEKIAQKGVEFLNDTFKTQISAESIEVDYFGNLIFHNVAVKDHHQYDFIKAEELKAYVNTISLVENLVILGKDDIKIDQVKLVKPVVRVITYKGEKQDNFSVFVAKFKSDKPPSNKPFLLEGRADLVDGQLSIANQNLPEEDQIWLDATSLNLKVSKVKIVDSDINVRIEQFNFKGKRHKENYVVNQLSGNLHYSDTELAFKDLTLESDTSLLLGTLYFKFTKENGFGDFANKVNWDLDLKQGSKVSGKDMRYFVKTWDSDAVVDVSAQAKGTLNALTLTNPLLSVNNTVYSSSQLVLKDLVREDNASFSINTKEARLQTSYASLKSWLPKFISVKIPEIISNLGTSNYVGEFSIDKNLLVTKGNLVSSVGSIKADARLTDYSSNNPKYEGWVETNHLNLAPFTKSSTIGPVTSKIYFDGKGFNPSHMDTKFDAKLASLEFNGKVIHSISAVGNLKNQIFKGKINTDDVHAKLDFQGDVDFSQKTIKTAFESDIKSLDLGYFIPVVDANTDFKGVIKTNVQFSSIDDLVGDISIKDIVLTKNQEAPVNYNDIQITTTSEGGNRNLDIFSPNMITANIYGKYKLNDVPAMLQEGIGNLLVNYKPKRRFDTQEFSFILDVQKDLFDLLMLDVNISPGTTITGRYIGKGNQLQTQIISQYIYYKNIKLSNPNVFLNTADSLRQFTGALSALEIGKTKVDNINFSGFKRNDSLFASTHFYYGKYKEKQTQFDLNLFQTRIGNDLIFGFRPSDIDFIQAKWTLNPDFNPDEAIAKYNVITNKLTLQRIVAKSDESEIVLSGEYTSKNEYNFDLNLKEVKLDKVISDNLLKDMSFEGVANGTAQIIKNSREFKPLVNLDVKGLKFNDQPLGDLDMNAVYNAQENKYLLDTKLIESGEERLLVQGYIMNEKGKPAQLDVELSTNKMNMAPIGTFLQNIFSKFRGEATGNVHITGDITNPTYQGILSMDKVGFTVNFLGVDYQLTKEQDLMISDGSFIFDNIELKDTKTNTLGTMVGFLQTKNFTEWGLNLDFNTDKLLVLNTTMKENDLFYGTVWASGEFSINGTTVKGIEISAKAKALEGSKLTINSSSTTNATDISFIKFVPEQHKDDEDEEAVKPPLGLTIRADVSADNKSVVDLIISQETGDKIEVRGDAKNLKFNMSPAGRITMEGTYTITGDSKYYYNMFVNKDFKIVPGSTLIWDGRGPTDASLNITANFTRGVSNIGDYLGTGAVPTTNVTVIARLTGYLSKPSIEFDIDAEASSSIREQLKTKLNNNEGEKYNQVAGIVVFGSFLSDKMGGNSYASSAYDVVLKQLTSVINNISGVFSLDANFNAGTRGVDNTSDRISLDPTFKLNQRLSIVGSVNMPLEQKSAADVWTYGAKIDYDISKNSDKTLMVSGFSKPSTFGLETSLTGASGANNQAYGGGIVYKRSFNHFKELFARKNKNKKQKTDSTAVKTEGK